MKATKKVQLEPLDEQELDKMNGGENCHTLPTITCPKCHKQIILNGSTFETLNEHYSKGQCKGSVFVL